MAPKEEKCQKHRKKGGGKVNKMRRKKENEKGFVKDKRTKDKTKGRKKGKRRGNESAEEMPSLLKKIFIRLGGGGGN